MEICVAVSRAGRMAKVAKIFEKSSRKNCHLGCHRPEKIRSQRVVRSAMFKAMMLLVKGGLGFQCILG